MLKTVYLSCCRDKYNCRRRDSNLSRLTPQSEALTPRLLRPGTEQYTCCRLQVEAAPTATTVGDRRRADRLRATVAARSCGPGGGRRHGDAHPRHGRQRPLPRAPAIPPRRRAGGLATDDQRRRSHRLARPSQGQFSTQHTTGWSKKPRKFNSPY